MDHLRGVASLSRRNAEKINCADYGEVMGLLHDLGKYSSAFQEYIRSAIGLLDPDADEDAVDAKSLKGKIDHSTAGAQLLWRQLSPADSVERLLSQMLSLCLVSHHSGVIDCLTTDLRGTNDSFTRRISKADEKTHFKEALSRAETTEKAVALMDQSSFVAPLKGALTTIFAALPQKNQRSTIFHFQIGLLTRFLFSSLIDADRQDTADSERPHTASIRQNGLYLPWKRLIERLERHLEGFGTPDPAISESRVNKIRADVSSHCLDAAKCAQGLFTLTVPTGGGKTLASLRFALHHAQQHKLDRILYVVPFTSIIDQNADVVRNILEVNTGDAGRIVLEHHSNVGSETQGWKEKLLCENWDAPVVYTTMVQFLETLFGGGTRGARRMHQLAQSVIVFDEIQTLPVRCVHLFCNAINFLVHTCGSSVVLCTATQPLLGKVDPLKGALELSPENEIMPDVVDLFRGLRRVDVTDSRCPSGWNNEELAAFAVNEVGISGSCLVVVNMKRSARALVAAVGKVTAVESFHLSTGMCPAHRRSALKTIRERLDTKTPILCISTQLIEAGVDIDFGSVIRYAAGLDSIAQAAGRCNRNGTRQQGRVFVVNPAEDNINCLKDIAVGREKAERVMNDFKADPGKYGNDLIGPASLEWYYENYFFGRKEDMDYPLSEKEYGRRDSLLNMLADNPLSVSDYQRVHGESPSIFLRQSFMAAGQIFKSIDAPTQSVIVQYGEEGKAIINDLCGSFDAELQFALLRKAQQFSVNLFPHEFRKLSEQGALLPVQDETAIFYLDSKYYGDQFGISMEPVNEEEFLHV